MTMCVITLFVAQAERILSTDFLKEFSTLGLTVKYVVQGASRWLSRLSIHLLVSAWVVILCYGIQ